MKLWKAVVLMTLWKWILPCVALAVNNACGPTVSNPPPTENPSLLVTKSIVSSVWNASYYEWTINVIVQNTGNVTLTSFTMPDSAGIGTYVPTGTFSVVAAPTKILGNASLVANGSWTGLASANAQLLTAGAPDTIAVGETVVIQYGCRITHGGFNGLWNDRAWARGISPASAVVTDEHQITLNYPSAPQTPTIGIAKSFGTVTGTAPNFSVPMTLIVKNLGNVTINRIDVRDTLANIFTAAGGGSSLTSVTGKSSKRFTFNAAYDGTASHAQMLSVLDADSLRIASTGNASTDTLAMTINFNAGTATTFFNSAEARATNLANTIAISDVSDWGTNPDPSGNGLPNDPGESDPSQFNVPVTSTADTLSLLVNVAGNYVGYAHFAEGALPVTQLTSGNGLLARDSLGTTYSTQYLDPVLLAEGGDGIVSKWPTTPPSVRIARLAFNAAHAGTHGIIQPGSAQAADSVNTTTDPGFEVVLNGTTYTFLRSDFTNVAAGRIYRTGIASKTDGQGTFAGAPGALEVMMEYRWYKDGTYRALVGIRNQRAQNSSTFQPAGAYSSSNTSQQAADWTINRKSGRVMRLRWASDYNLGSGADTSTVHLWHSGSYTHPSGAGSSFGGQLRAGENLWVEVTDQSNLNPPEGWYTASYYKLTKAIHDTDNLALFTGPAYNSADSLKWRWEAQARGWVEGVDGENPYRSDWINIRDAGGQIRLFDGGTSALGMMEGNDQYRTDHGTLKLALAASRVTNDTMAVGHPNFTSVAWKLFEQGARKHAHGCYTNQYDCSGRDFRFAWGTMWPHTAHNSNDIAGSGRSSQTPSASYLLQGDATLDLWDMTGWDVYRQTYRKIVANRVFYATNSQYRGDVVNNSEARAAAGEIMWLGLHYDITDSTTYRDLALAVVRDRFAREDFGQDPCPPSGTTWNGDKPWMWQLFITELRQFARILERHGDATEASEMRDYIAEWQIIFATHGVYTTNVQYVGANYPTCNSASTPSFTFEYYGWGSADCPANTCCTDNSFWAAIGGSVMADYGADTTLWRDLWRSGVAYVGSGNNYLCPGEYEDEYQKFGIPAHWSWDALRQYEGTLDQRASGDHPTEIYYDE